MTAMLLEEAPTAEETAQRFAVRYRDALRDYVVGLSEILDVRTIKPSPEDDEFDFVARVPSAELYFITQKLADLAFFVNEKHGVRIATMAVPG